MREGVATDAAGHLSDDACGDRLVYCLQHLRAVAIAHALQRVEAELPPDDRCERQHAVARRAQARQALPDDLLHARRQAERVRRPIGRPAALALDDRAALDEVAQHLLDEERIAFRGVVDRTHQPSRRHRAVRPFDQACHVGFREALQVHRASLTNQVGDDLARRRARLHLAVAVGHEHQHPCLAEVSREKLEQAQRRQVRGVEIVEHHQRRLVRRGTFQ